MLYLTQRHSTHYLMSVLCQYFHVLTLSVQIVESIIMAL